MEKAKDFRNLVEAEYDKTQPKYLPKQDTLPQFNHFPPSKSTFNPQNPCPPDPTHYKMAKMPMERSPPLLSPLSPPLPYLPQSESYLHAPGYIGEVAHPREFQGLPPPPL